MACTFKQDGNPRWCTTIQGECQFLTADDGPKCPVYDAFPEGWTKVDPDDPPSPPTPVLPYDAEIMYLEGTGTQWIETGIYPRDNLHVSLRSAFTSMLSFSKSFPFSAISSKGKVI